MKSLPFSLCVLLSSMPLMAVTYHEPGSQEILIRTDKLPIDPDTMRWLSKQLTVIAERENSGTAEQLRANAQLIALAKRLDNGNKGADALNKQLLEGEKFNPKSSDDVAKATSRVWSLTKFLSSKSAGEEANALAAYIMDAMSVVDPKHPALADYQPSAERWANTVANLDKFKEEPKIASSNQPEIASNNSRVTDVPSDGLNDKQWPSNEQDEKDKEEPKNDDKVAWHELKTKFTVPLQEQAKVGDRDIQRAAISQVQVEIKPNHSDSEKRLEITSNRYNDNNSLKRLEHPVRQTLDNVWKRTPNAKVEIRLVNDLSYKNQDYLQSNLILFLDTSLSNKEYNPNILALTKIEESGKFVRNDDFWTTMMMVAGDSNAQRRILAPKDAEDDLRQLIALEKAEFFARNEVILVDSLEESRHYTSSTTDEKIKEATALFAEFQSVAESRSLGALSANKHVRERMEKILALMPNHLSAKMILLQGSGNRPLKLESKFLAYEMDGIIAPVASYIRRVGTWSESSHYTSNDLEGIYTKMEKRLEEIRNYVDSKDNNLYTGATDMVSNLKSISRASGRQKDFDEKRGYYERAARNSYENLKGGFVILDSEIAKLTGRKTTDFDRGFKKNFRQ